MIRSKRWLAVSCAAAVALGVSSPSMAQQPPEVLRPVIPTNLTPYVVALYSPREGAAPMGLDITRAHLEFIKAQVAAGVIRFGGPMQGSPAIGMIVLATSDITAARAIIDRDPMVTGGFVEVSLQGAMLPNLDVVQVIYP